MAQERLTDQTSYTSKPADDDVIHMVDVSDDTDHSSGSSRKVRIDDLLKGRTFQTILGCLVFKFASSPTKTTIVSGDWVVWMSDSNSSDRMVVGVAKDSITSVPADFNVKAKFDKFIDSSSLL